MVAIYSQMLKRKYAGRLDADADEYIRYTVEGATRMEQLLKDLLLYTQLTNVTGRPPEAPVNRCSAPVALGKPFVMLWNDRHAAFAVRRRDYLPCPS